MKTDVNKQQELKKLIEENPTLELKFFVADDATSGDFSREEADISGLGIMSLALFEEEDMNTWCDDEDYEEKLIESLADNYEDEEVLNLKVKEELAKVKFEKFIVVNIG